MTDEHQQDAPPDPLADPEEWQAYAANLARVAERSQEVIANWLSKQDADATSFDPDPLNLGESFLALTARMMEDPARLAEAQMALMQDYWKLWETTARRMMGEGSEPVAAPEPGDRRFKDKEWSENALFDFIKQSYLITARSVNSLVSETEGLDPDDERKTEFYTRQFLNALSPSNFLHTNPEVLRATLESKGENLVKGLENLLKDIDRSEDGLRISMTDESAFEVGRNIAVTPGKVVYENELFQLIQYSPATDEAHEVPLLIYPPWINKFYILDLTPEKSFIKWCVDQGLTVFVVSWVNPDASYRDKGLDAYMRDGMLEALARVEEITGIRGVNVIGYCVAGTMLAAMLAILEARGQGDRVRAATFFTAQVDFENAGDLKVFIDDEQLEALSERMEEKGYLDAQAMFTTFNLLRSNDLIWSFVVNNYLLGKEPFPFDLLYWNSDSTNLPATLHAQYLKYMYRENRLVEPGGLTIDGAPVDLSRIRTPVYIQAAKEDHIAPPASVYKLTHIVGGPKRFLLAGSGHIAGVINPPAANKYQYWTRKGGKLPKDFERFVAGSAETPGSWWPDWLNWLGRHSGGKIPARQPGSKDFPAIEDAPGRYVRQRAM